MKADKGESVKITCPQCAFSREVPEEKLPKGSVIAKCPRCACRFHFSAKDGVGTIVPPKNESSEEEDIRVIASNAYAREANRYANEREAANAARQRQIARNPWEEAPSPDGWLAAFYQTAIRVMFQAPIFFRGLAPQGRIWRPLAFFLIVCLAQTLIERGWAAALYSFLSGTDDPQMASLLKLVAPTGSLWLLLLLRTGSLLLQLFVFSLLMFLVYRIVAPGRATFMLVYQIMAYSSAPWLLCVVPGIGSLAGTFWSVGCLAIGCKSAMSLGWPQTLAGFLPLVALMIPLISQIAGMTG